MLASWNLFAASELFDQFQQVNADILGLVGRAAHGLHGFDGLQNCSVVSGISNVFGCFACTMNSRITCPVDPQFGLLASTCGLIRLAAVRGHPFALRRNAAGRWYRRRL